MIYNREIIKHLEANNNEFNIFLKSLNEDLQKEFAFVSESVITNTLLQIQSESSVTYNNKIFQQDSLVLANFICQNTFVLKIAKLRGDNKNVEIIEKNCLSMLLSAPLPFAIAYGRMNEMSEIWERRLTGKIKKPIIKRLFGL